MARAELARDPARVLELILLLTGESGSGKTRLCDHAAETVAGAGREVSGVLCPGVFSHSGERGQILARLLPGGETRPLASVRAISEDVSELATPRWSFDRDTVLWVDAHLAGLGPTDLLIVDELGPLELERGKGFISAFDLLDRGAFRLALVVVRPSLLGLARLRWPEAQVHDVARDPAPGFL